MKWLSGSVWGKFCLWAGRGEARFPSVRLGQRSRGTQPLGRAYQPRRFAAFVSLSSRNDLFALTGRIASLPGCWPCAGALCDDLAVYAGFARGLRSRAASPVFG